MNDEMWFNRDLKMHIANILLTTDLYLFARDVIIFLSFNLFLGYSF